MMDTDEPINYRPYSTLTRSVAASGWGMRVHTPHEP